MTVPGVETVKEETKDLRSGQANTDPGKDVKQEQMFVYLPLLSFLLALIFLLCNFFFLSVVNFFHTEVIGEQLRLRAKAWESEYWVQFQIPSRPG